MGRENAEAKGSVSVKSDRGGGGTGSSILTDVSVDQACAEGDRKLEGESVEEVKGAYF